MEALISFIRENCLPKNLRSNINTELVCSVTVGAVDKRGDGYGISASTTLHKGMLTKLLHGVAQDVAIRGDGPRHYSSICLNVDVKCRLHVDGRNEGSSFVVAGGEYTGGELFLASDENSSATSTYAVEETDIHTAEEILYVGSLVKGNKHDIHMSWKEFTGNTPHAVCPFEGFRISCVFLVYLPRE